MQTHPSLLAAMNHLFNIPGLVHILRGINADRLALALQDLPPDPEQSEAERLIETLFTTNTLSLSADNHTGSTLHPAPAHPESPQIPHSHHSEQNP
ncbi:MAG: hypothetical protein F6K30_22275, partial [Cyanothece sp. SIO2G6]|nr:hypothetical protein [Cyanothece sp. SIO2G6]